MKKIGELSFSFERRRVSVILDDGDNLHVVTKGAVEEMLSICTMYEDDQDHPTPFTDQLRQQIQKHIDELKVELEIDNNGTIDEFITSVIRAYKYTIQELHVDL